MPKKTAAKDWRELPRKGTVKRDRFLQLRISEADRRVFQEIAREKEVTVADLILRTVKEAYPKHFT